MSKVLIVDDDDAVLRTIAAMVASLGHECVLFNNVIDAIAAVETGAIELALIDMHMPGLDGLEAIKALVHITPRVSIIAMSGGSDGMSSEDYRILTAKLGAGQFLQKPFTRARLAEVIAKALP